MFDLMLFLEDEPTQVRNVKFRLLPPANDEWAMGIFKDAISAGTALGSVWGGAYEEEITKASAVPLDKKQLQANLKKKDRPEPAAEPETEEEPEAARRRMGGRGHPAPRRSRRSLSRR